MIGRRHPTRLAAALALPATLALAAPAGAATFKPTRFDDPPPGKCKQNDCSLREAINAAEGVKEPGKVILATGAYTIELPDGGNTDNEDGDFDITSQVAIRGQGPGKTRVVGGSVDRVFEFTPLVTVPQSLRDVTVKGGLPASLPSLGGGIKSINSMLTLRDVVVKQNEAQRGGGIYSLSDRLTVKGSTVSDNAAAQGGGIFIGAWDEPNEEAIRSSTISSNDAGVGAGLAVDGLNQKSLDEEPFVGVLNSTFAMNDATVSGGGISAIQSAHITLESSTVAYNGADVDNSAGGNGGGLHQSTSAGFTLGDSLIAANTVGSSGNGEQCAGTFPGQGGNLVQSQPGTACSIGGAFSEPADALIGPLENNGGPMKTVKLLSGSPAIGLGIDCPKRDQRGLRRPDSGCDSGAYERRKP